MNRFFKKVWFAGLTLCAASVMANEAPLVPVKYMDPDVPGLIAEVALVCRMTNNDQIIDCPNLKQTRQYFQKFSVGKRPGKAEIAAMEKMETASSTQPAPLSPSGKTPESTNEVVKPGRIYNPEGYFAIGLLWVCDIQKGLNKDNRPNEIVFYFGESEDPVWPLKYDRCVLEHR